MKRRSSKLPKKGTDSKYNVVKFNVIGTLFSSVKLALYNFSHRQPMKRLIHKSKFSTVSIPTDCATVYSCSLYHGLKNQ